MKNNIKKLRKEKGISVNQLAGLLDTSHSTILNWESQAYQPNAKFLAPLSKIFECEIIDIIKQ